MKKLVTLCIFLLLNIGLTLAQGVTIQVTDAQTGESLPNASIVVNDTDNLIANNDGYFTLTNNEDAAKVLISYIGYNRAVTTAGALKQAKQIKLNRAVYELTGVNISSIGNNPDAIMAAVKKNLNDNYKYNGKPEKNRVFFRESSVIMPVQIDADITESTGFSKAQLKEINKDIGAMTKRVTANPPREFTDILGDYYRGSGTANGKTTNYAKFEVVKATKLKDLTNGGSLEELGEKSLNIIGQHLDTTKYYRMKSGWFGSRDTVPLFDGKKNRKDKVKQRNNDMAQSRMLTFMTESSILSNKLTFIAFPEWYNYEYKGIVQSEEGMVTVLTFSPRKGKAKYAGTLYISNSDYGVVRADFALAKGKTLGGVNLKLLLGVKQSENVSKGTLMYKKRPEGEGYYLQYASRETGQYIYMNRPVKFIEITEGDKDVFAIDVKFEANMLDKEEYFNMKQNEITATGFDAIKQPDFDYILLKRYDPAIWKEYGGIEPLEEMKQFRVVE